MRRVILESPFKANESTSEEHHIWYARQCMRDSLLRGEAPIASHLLYTQEGILDDSIEIERNLGISAGLLWGELAEATVLYGDYGLSSGMEWGVHDAKKHNRPIEIRYLYASNQGSIDERVNNL